MLAAMTKGASRFWFFFKKETKKTAGEELKEFFDKSPNLGYLAKDIIDRNKNRPKLLPPQKPEHKGKLTVVMELDQVLTYTFTPDEQGYLLSPLRKHDIYYEWDEYDVLLSIYKRKNLQNFLNYVSQQCEPVIWSAGVPSYVELMMNFIDPQKRIPYVLSQPHCDPIQVKSQDIDIFVKDLQLLGRNLEKVVYMDSKPLAYWLYPDNCLPMQEFRADMTMQNQDLNLFILNLQNLKKQQSIPKYFAQRYDLRSFLTQAKLL